MSTSLSMHEAWFALTTLLDWRDIIEIITCSSMVYYFSLWLKNDRQKNLLGYFYAYCVVGFSAHAAHLTTITYLMCLCSPIAFLIFIMIHQQTLQKNFVTLRSLTPAYKDSHDWVETLIRSCLVAVNNNKKIMCIIEHNHTLNEHVHAGVVLNAPVKDDLLSLIIESQAFTTDQFLWVNSKGILLGFNAYLTHPLEEIMTPELLHLERWKQQALCCSAKTDALFLHISPTNRLFDGVINGTLFESMSASDTLVLIEKSLKISYQQSLGENNHAAQSKKNSMSEYSA